ncbi:MAG: hypothetical protein NC093_07905 [Alistipes sp.]|nr:hypothetical protein [Alistipes sp.]
MITENTIKEVIPFDVDSTVAWNSLLKHLAQKEDTPVNIASESRYISSEKIYYPVERLTVNYEAKWNAVSIFMRYWTETETYFVQEVHYFDRWGREHTQPGFDYFDTESGKWRTGTFHPIKSRVKGYSGSVTSRPWDPREVTVEKSREIPYEQETGRKNSSGTVKSNMINALSERYPFFNVLYGTYSNGERSVYSDEAVEGTVVDEMIFADGEKNKELILKAKNVAQETCIKQIPGQKYANFSMDFVHNIDREIWYYPAYKIVYTYQDKQYECLVSGACCDCVYETTYPTDDFMNTIFQDSEKEKDELKQKKKKVTKELLISIAAVMFLEPIALVLFAPLGAEFATIAIFAIIAVGGYYIYRKYLERVSSLKFPILIRKKKMQYKDARIGRITSLIS